MTGQALIPKKNEWIDGKQKEEWVGPKNIGWVVCTAGWINMDLLPSNGRINYRAKRSLPPGYRMILKDIDNLGNAICYNDDNGVVSMPVELLEPWVK